jgi:hypothetical protein
MCAFLFALNKLLFLKEPISKLDSDYYVVAFGIGCIVASFIVMAVEYANQYIRGSSLFALDYEGRSQFMILCSWAIAAFATGVFGLSLDVLQPTVQGCIGVAVSWPLLLSVLTGLRSAPSPGGDADEEPEGDVDGANA